MSAMNPATDELIREITSDTEKSARMKFEAAKEAQKDWAQVPVSKRIGAIENFAALLLENKNELAMDLCLEVGKPITEAIAEVEAAAKKCAFFIEESERLLREETVNIDGNTQEVLAHDPLGVVGNISAWNYPYLVGINVFVPALICGNGVLYKPSEHASATGENIARTLWQAGIPRDLFQIVQGDGEMGKTLCELGLDGYFFTGSYPTGVKIAQACAPRLVPVGLELGGKDPLYVADDVKSIKEAAHNAVEGSFYNNGQSCCSVERIYVHEKIYDEFLAHFLKKAKSLVVGDPTDPKTQIGAITRKEHIRFLEGQLEDALAKGASLLCGGERVGTKGSFFSPTVLADVNHGMSLMREETFGPMIGIQKVASDEEAIDLMNDTDYGLTAAVFTGSRTRGEAILRKVDSGTGYLNCCDRVSAHLPWSGRKNSGLGTTLSKHGLYAFCAPRGFHFRT